MKKKKVSGRNSKLKTLEDEVFACVGLLPFLREFSVFDLDKSNICRHIQRLESMLANAVKINKNRRLMQDNLESALIDATKISIQRLSK